MIQLTEEEVNPFVRCVGRGVGIDQKVLYCACDYRLVYFMQDGGEVLCGGERFDSKAGSLFLFAPGTPFSIRSSPAQECIVVNFDWTQNHAALSAPVLSVEADEFTADRIIEKVQLSFLEQDSDMLWVQELFEAEELLRALYKVYFADVRPSGLRMSGLAKQLLGMLADRLRSTQQKNGKPFLLAEQIMAYVQEHYAQKLALEDVAARFHYHPTYINRVMKLVSGVSFHQYLIDYRLRQSLQLLEMKDLTLEEIAERTGFSNSKHFSACFTKHFQVSPSRYI